MAGLMPASHAAPRLIGVAPSASPASALSATAQLSAQVLATADHRQRPFAVVDKQTATISVFTGQGRLLASSSVLLGQAPGDHAVRGAGERTQQGLLSVDDRTTPAGRFDTEPGRNLSGEAIVWIDYDSALAIHRVRPGAAQLDRQLRLASTDPLAKRVSAGCVVVPEAFFDAVIGPLFGRQRGVVYVLPEDSPWQRLWPALADKAESQARQGAGIGALPPPWSLNE